MRYKITDRRTTKFIGLGISDNMYCDNGIDRVNIPDEMRGFYSHNNDLRTT